jgi:glucose/arabinose dehydrogenase
MVCSRKSICLFVVLLSLVSYQALAQQVTLGLSRVVAGLRSPTNITHAGDNSGRLFVAEQGGRIRIVRSGVLIDAPFLDISDRVLFDGERGLLGLAFPPGFAYKNHFYVYYTSLSGDNVLARYSVTADNADAGDAASETILLTLPHRIFANHNGGQLAFGVLDGYLYIAVGDGGGGGDTLGNAQNLGSLLGKLLRIDVESGAIPYAVPPDNPFVHDPQARPEIWAYGLRNPWRFSFDRLNGNLYIADVGQGKYEEIEARWFYSSRGENHGWNRMEGAHCYPVDDGNCSTDGLSLPDIEYDHSSGNCSITGGYVYRGGQYPLLQGTYLYGDYCSGRIWGATFDSAWRTALLLQVGFLISTFGEDQDGNVYIAAHNTGEAFRITAESQ